MNQKYYPKKPILMVDDEQSWLVSLEMLLTRHGQINNLVSCTDSSKVLALLAEQEFSLVLLDYGMPGVSGEELLKQIVVLYPQLPVVVLTGYDQVETAVRCKDLGAKNYFVKTQGELSLAQNILEVLYAITESHPETNDLAHPELFADVIALSPGMQAACQAIDAAVGQAQHLLMVGENGAGKRFLAGILMAQKTGRICLLDAEQVVDTQFNDETWVDNLLADAGSGHVYLQNVDALPQDSQLHLLKLLQQQREVRFVVTLKDLEPETTANLRDDLLYLLKANLVEVPPLRERKEDLADLTQLFLHQAAEEYEKKTPTPPPELNVLLQSYVFPGNVAELRSMVFAAVFGHESRKMSMDSFKQAMAPGGETLAPHLQFSEVLPTIEEAVSMLIDEAGKRADGNQSIMAEMLGISRQALNKRLVRRKQKA